MRYYDFNGEKVRLTKGTYSNNGTLALCMEQKDGSTYGVATVNLCHPFQSDTDVFLDENNHPGIGKLLEDNGLAEPLNYSSRSGFCEYPLYTVRIDAI